MKKKILSIALVLCRVFAILPTAVFAADDTTELQEKLNNGGTVKLQKDYVITSTLSINKDVTLDLNGYVLKMNSQGVVIRIGEGCRTFTLSDSSPARTHSGDFSALPAGGLIVGFSKTAQNCNGVVNQVSGSLFVMNGGTIMNCSGNIGGGITIGSGASFVMNNGIITECHAKYEGGGVNVTGNPGTDSGYFTMNGGTIENCSSDHDYKGVAFDCVNLGLGAKFHANGGTVKGNIRLINVTVDSEKQNSCTTCYGTVLINSSAKVKSGVFYGGTLKYTVNIDDPDFTIESVITSPYYTVSFDPDGGTGDIPTQYFVNITSAKSLKPAAPSRDGYRFLGWYNGNTEYKFDKPVTANVSLKAKWESINVSSESELKNKINLGLDTVKLTSNIKLTSTLDLSDITLTIDLNGHVLTGDIKIADSSSSNKSEITLIDSNPTATHSDTSLPAGGVLKGNITLTRDGGSKSVLFANGGSVMGSLNLHSYASKVYNSDNKTTTSFYGNVNVAVNNAEICTGIYYKALSQNFKSSVKGKLLTFYVDGNEYCYEVCAQSDGSVNAASAVTPVSPTKDGCDFLGWYTAQEGGTKFDFNTVVTADITLFACWTDSEAPIGEIALGTNSWKTFLNNITFSMFFKDTQEVTITATDNSGEDVMVEYLLSDKEFSETELATATFTEYTGKFTIEPNNEYVIYAKLTDKTGNVAYINSNGIVLDNVAPVISGIADGETYCSAQTVNVSDKYEVTVTVNGNPVTPDTNGQFTLSPAEVGQKIVVTDKAGNKTEMTVTVNDGHTYDWQNENGQYWQKCRYCEHETEKKDIPEITINGADKVCVIQDYKFTVTVPEGVTDVIYGYDFENKGDSDIALNPNNGICSATISSEEFVGESSFKLLVSATTADGYTISTSKTVQILSEHIGGTATCIKQAECDVCKTPYGTTNPDNHTGKEHLVLKNATATTLGNIEYWHCKDCDKYYSDSHYKNSISKESTYIYAVVFDTKGGTGIAAKNTVKWSDNVLDGVTAPTKAGWDFIGWKCGDKDVTEKTTYGDLALSKTSAGVELEAQWKSRAANTLVLHGNGGLTSSSSDVYTSYTGGASIKVSNVPFTKKGYCFNAWNNKADGKGEWYRKGATVNFTAVHNGEKIELYAIWEANYYTIVFDSNGAEGTMKNLSMRYDKKANLTANAFTNDGYEFVSWNTAPDDKGTEYTNGQEVLNLTDVSKGTVTLYAQWKDVSNPSGSIIVGENSWNEFLNTITFGLFFKDTQEVTVTATDNSGEDVTIEYLLSDKELSESELATATFTTYTGKFTVEPNNEYVIYAKLTDKAGNVAYINSNGIVLDNVKPVISGIEDGKTYCEAQTVTVSDKYVVTVTVNGNPVTPDTNGQFTLSAAEGEQKIVVTDKAGNQTEMTVTVNDGHTYYWQSENGKYWQKCNFCEHETAKKDIPEITINGADKVCRMQNYTFTFTLPEGVTDPKAAYYPAESNRPLVVTENDGVYTATVSHTEYEDDYNISKFFVKVYAKTADGFEFLVRKEVLFSQEHTGGTADCTHKAICEVCGEPYGEVDNSNHDLEHTEEKTATVTETGNTEYWQCRDCGNNFSDKDGKNAIALKDTVIGKLPPEIIDGIGQSLTVGEKKKLSFRSNAAFGDFIRVELDGETVERKNYTVKEGSTIVTLKADYVATLSEGEHTLGIVSQSGTAEATFTVNAKAVNNNTSPATGDNSNISLWFILLFVSGGALAGTGLYGKKKKYFEK